MAIVRRDPEEVLDVLLPVFTPLAGLLMPMTIALIEVIGRRERERDRDAPANGAADAPATPPPEADRRRERDLRGGRPRAAAVDRGFHRNGGERGDDAAARHRGGVAGQHAAGSAHRVSRGAVLADAGLPRQPRQRRRRRLRQGSGGPAAGRRAAGHDADAVALPRAREQARVGPAERDAAPPGADGGGGGRIRRHRRAGHHRGPARGDRRRDPRRVRRRERDRHRRRATACSCSRARSAWTRCATASA